MTTDDAANNNRRQEKKLFRDRSFYGVVLTQFLGAFNDNLFRQMVLLYCLHLAQGSQANLQGHAVTVFAVPFILLSGYCGYLSAIFSKRQIVVISKALEIVIMVAGLFAFRAGNVYVMLVVLFFMGAQSALFGPSKYGILPELFPSRDLLRVNGVVQMTTFLAIIFGLALAGQLMDLFKTQIWIASFACVIVALIGTATSLLIRHTPVAQAGMKFEWSMLAVGQETRQLLWKNRRLRGVLLATSIFWMTGSAVYPPAINDLGKEQLGLSDTATSLLASSTGLGIMVGCLLGGILSKEVFSGSLVRRGLWGMTACLLLISCPGSIRGTLLGVTGSGLALFSLGIAAGLYTVPLMAYLQSRTPDSQKGRIIGAMNLANWIGIALAGQYYNLGHRAVVSWGAPQQAMFAIAALLLVPLLVRFHPESESMSSSPSSLQPGIES